MRLSIRQKLLGAFAVDLLLMIGLGAFAVAQMGRMNAKAAEIETRTIPSLQNVEAISDVISGFRSLQVEYLLFTNRADRARLERSMVELEDTMAEVLSAHEALIDRGASADRPAERQALERVRAEWNAYLEEHASSFLPAARRTSSGTAHPALSRLNPRHRRLEQAADRLSELAAADAGSALAVVADTHEGSQRFIVADTLLSVIVSAVVGLLLAATLARRIRRLTAATRRVAAGDLDQQVPLEGHGDEIAVLSENFNRMVDGLRRQHDTLELRHDELRESLSQQRRLTDEQRRLTEDLMERKRAEEAAVRARAAAEARSSAKSLFLATMSHELRTPLNAILGYAQILELQAQRDGAAARGDGVLDDLGRIRAAGRHLLTLIDNILDFSKLEQGKVDVEIVRFRIDELAREVIALLEPLAVERGDRLALRCALEADDAVMESDPAKVRQIFFNLLSNAVKFTEDGAVELAIERDPADDLFICRVRDTGIGIAAEHQERIFEPFRQADASTHRRFGGTGLGLVVSRQLCELLGGDLEVESELGRGSTFTARLPPRVPVHATALEGTEPWPRSSSSTTTETTAAS